MSKFRRLRQHAGTTRTVIPTPTSLNPYQETDAEKAASTVHGDNNIAALDRWVHRDGTVIYVIPSLEPDAAETLEQQQKSFSEQLPRFFAGSEAGQALPPRHANGGGRVMRAHCADGGRALASDQCARKKGGRWVASRAALLRELGAA